MTQQNGDDAAAEPPEDAATPGVDTDRPTLTEHEARLNALSKRLDRLQDMLEEIEGERDELREENERLAERVDELEGEIERLDARTDLLSLVEDVDEMTGKQRSVALIQHLNRAAEKQRERGEPAKASVNRGEAERALQYPDVDRTTIYDDMRRAARLVGNKDVLWYAGASGGESRLKLSLDAGDLPSKIVGQRTNQWRR